MIIDGRAIAEEILSGLTREREGLQNELKLGIVMTGGDRVIDSFVGIKERVARRLRVTLVREELPSGATTADATAAVARLAGICSGIIVQLPLPSTIETEKVLANIPPQCDVDAINPLVADNDRLVASPVAEAVLEILSRTNLDPRGKSAVIVGEGRLVGKPVAHLLEKLGARVSVISRTSGSHSDLAYADIIVSGAGEPGIIMPKHIKEGAVLIDAGTSEDCGKIAGDVDPACETRASVFTPVPGGVGPIAVAMIFKNLFKLASSAKK